MASETQILRLRLRMTGLDWRNAKRSTGPHGFFRLKRKCLIRNDLARFLKGIKKTIPLKKYAKQTQFSGAGARNKANLEAAKMMLTAFLKTGYDENARPRHLRKQSQTKPNKANSESNCWGKPQPTMRGHRSGGERTRSRERCRAKQSQFLGEDGMSGLESEHDTHGGVRVSFEAGVLRGRISRLEGRYQKLGCADRDRCGAVPPDNGVAYDGFDLGKTVAWEPCRGLNSRVWERTTCAVAVDNNVVQRKGVADTGRIRMRTAVKSTLVVLTGLLVQMGGIAEISISVSAGFPVQ
jgi:hypothetical protein